MPSFISAVVVAVVIAIGASFVLDGYQKGATTAYQTSGVRL